MSLWKLGEADLSEDTIAFKNKISAQDAELSAQQNQVLKQAAELKQLQVILTETLAKLGNETKRGMELEANLSRCSQDLTHTRTSSQNVQSSLASANARIKEQERETRDLHGTIELLSDDSSEVRSQVKAVENQRDSALTRVKALEKEIHLSSFIVTSPTKPSKDDASTSLSELKISSLEAQLHDIRAQVSLREQEVAVLDQKLSSARNEQASAENEKVALERRLGREILELKSVIEEKDEELLFLQSRDGGDAREQELLSRIEADEAHIAALEQLLRSDDARTLNSELAESLRCQSIRIENAERANVDLVAEKEGALNRLDAAQTHVLELQAQFSPLSHTELQVDSTTETVSKLLEAVDRLRQERDELRRQVEFLEPESRFALQALDAEISAKDPSVHPSPPLLRRLSVMAMASTVVISHLHSQLLVSQDLLACGSTGPVIPTSDTRTQENHITELTSQVESLTQTMSSMVEQRDDLVTQLAEKEVARRELQDLSTQLELQVSDVQRCIDDSETERSSLSLQVAHLERDLSAAQSELVEAESRYSSLQFHQLADMTSSEATQVLKNQIHELEMRVMRRTEQIGLHQHDIGRLETNLKVAEERVSEMTAELEMMSSQKEAMVEDCADARDARDDALHRTESLEDDIEDYDTRLASSESALIALIQTFVQSLSDSRTIATSHATLSARLSSLSTDHLHLHDEGLASQAEIQSLRTQLRSFADDVKQSTTALAITHLHAHKQSQANLSLISQITTLQTQLDSEIWQNKELTSQLATLQVEGLPEQAPDIQQLQELLNLREDLASTAEALRMSEASLLQNERDFEKRYADSIQFMADEWSAKLDPLEKEVELLKADRDTTQASLDNATIAHDALVVQLEDTEMQYRSQIDTLEETLHSLEDQLHSTTSQLSQSRTDLEQFAQRLQDEEHARAQDHEMNRLTILSETERSDKAETLVSLLRRDISEAQAQIAELQVELRAAEAASSSQKADLTLLSRQAKESISLSQDLEAKIQIRNNTIAQLSSEVNDCRSNIGVLSEQRSRLEGEFSLATVRHQREVETLEIQLNTFRSQPDLKSVLGELEDRNNEMEELLRQKCVEIEENDDRVLQRIKENKKLVTKVESLTRKVQNLQAKLAAAKATATAPLPEPRHLPQPSLNMATPKFSLEPPQREEIPQVVSTVFRSISGPSSLPRPKTPEKRVRSQTPEKRIQSQTWTPEKRVRSQTPERRVAAHPPLPIASGIGRKRPAPDDFESVPTQAFTADSRPSDLTDNDTPKVRKVLSNIQSGFTPSRGRPIVSLPSPKRDGNTFRPHIPENSPLPPISRSSDQPAKRSWLGKIRGASHVTPSHTGSSKHSFLMTN